MNTFADLHFRRCAMCMAMCRLVHSHFVHVPCGLGLFLPRFVSVRDDQKVGHLSHPHYTQAAHIHSNARTSHTLGHRRTRFGNLIYCRRAARLASSWQYFILRIFHLLNYFKTIRFEECANVRSGLSVTSCTIFAVDCSYLEWYTVCAVTIFAGDSAIALWNRNRKRKNSLPSFGQKCIRLEHRKITKWKWRNWTKNKIEENRSIQWFIPMSDLWNC